MNSYKRIFCFIITVFIVPVSLQAKTLLILGDSLSAAYGMPVEAGWVALLKQRLVRQGLTHKVVNASISGETTLGAKSRLSKLLTEHVPGLVIIELGGNDGLRGFKLDEIKRNLYAMISMIQQTRADVLLIPMQLPPNYGKAYNEKFRSIYTEISAQTNIALSEFILKDIAINPELMQADGIHPLASAQAIMLDNIWPSLRVLLE